MAMRTPTITIAGLGPGNPTARTLAVQHALDAAGSIVLRTAIHPGIEDLIADSRVVACDDLYDSSASFDETYAAIVERVIEAAKSGSVTYVVPGSSVFGERTVQLIAERAAEEGIAVDYVPAISALEVVAQAAGIDLLTDQPQLIDALDLVDRVAEEPFSGSQTALDPTRWAIVSQVFNRQTASDVKHALSRIWPEQHPVDIVHGAGSSDIVIQTMSLAELDHVDHDHLTTLVVRPVPWLQATTSPSTLFRIVARLRAPGGCPWDREQTHESIGDKAIEEAHEVAEAIADDDSNALRDELGDLLLLVALHSQIAEEAGEFTIEDVFDAVNRKLVRRHPHVFGDFVAQTPDDVLGLWKQVKAEEKGLKTPEEAGLRYDQLPRTMSVVERIRRSDGRVSTRAGENSQEIGGQLLALVETALADGIDPEAALENAYRTARLEKMK